MSVSGVVKRLDILIATCFVFLACGPSVEVDCDVEPRDLHPTFYVYLDKSITVTDVQQSGECTNLVEEMDTNGRRRWRSRMTGAVGSTCTVRLVTDERVFEHTSTLMDTCGVRHGFGTDFDKEL